MMQKETIDKLYADKESLKRKALRAAAIGTIVVGAAAGIANMNNGPTIPKGDEAHKSYTVKPGDTAWAISERAAPNSDPRILADEIIKQDGSVLTPGEKVNLPDSSPIGTEVTENSQTSSSG